MRINTNVSALNSQRVLQGTNAEAARVIGRLSSGFRINRAADDAAGLGIANRLSADVRSLSQAARNAEQANSMLQVMEGGASQIQGILERMKELASQSNSDSADSSARSRLNTEFEALQSELDRIVATTTFQGNKLLNGSFGSAVNKTTGQSTLLDNAATTTVYDVSLNGTSTGTYAVANGTAGSITVTKDGVSQVVAVGSNGKQDVTFSNFGITLKLDADYSAAGTAVTGNVVVTAGASGASFMVSSSGAYGSDDLVSLNQIDVDTDALGIDSTDIADISSAANAQSALTKIDSAISTLSDKLAQIGAAQNRVDYALANVKASVENVAAAESVIRDADMAAEMTEFSRLQILQQAGTAMLAQANSAPSLVLRLLQG